MKREEITRLWRSRQAQKANQISGCPECSGAGSRGDIVKNENGDYVEKGWSKCARCGGDGYGLFCAICGGWAAQDELDFHHWDYDEHIGVFLCRDCHDGVHGGEEAYPSNNEEWAREAAQNAVEMLLEEQPTNITGLSGHEEKSWFEKAVIRLNIPNKIPVSAPPGAYSD